MKCFRRYFSLLLCLVLSLGVFSVTANAEEFTLEDLAITGYVVIDGVSSTPFTFYPGDGTVNTDVPMQSSHLFRGKKVSVVYHWTLANKSGYPLVNKSEYAATFTLSQAYYSIYGYCGSGFYDRVPLSARALVTYSSGAQEYFETEFTNSGTDMQIEFNFVPTENVVSVEFIVTGSISMKDISGTHTVQGYIGEHGGDNKWIVTVDEFTRSEGFYLVSLTRLRKLSLILKTDLIILSKS